MNMKLRTHLSAGQLLAGTAVEAQIDNLSFTPFAPFDNAQHALALSLEVEETPMNCNHQGVKVNEKSVDLFPATRLRLASDNGELLPLDRDLLRDPEGNSYWDVTLSPGRVWSEQGDGQWSRATLPFQLTNINN